MARVEGDQKPNFTPLKDITEKVVFGISSTIDKSPMVARAIDKASEITNAVLDASAAATYSAYFDKWNFPKKG